RICMGTYVGCYGFLNRPWLAIRTGCRCPRAIFFTNLLHLPNNRSGGCCQDRRMKRFLLLCLCSVCAHAATGPLVVHEWGTFTSLQDETGRAIGGINSDDEPVPRFVHDLNRLLILKPEEMPPVCFQGAPRCHPCVTLRLE